MPYRQSSLAKSSAQRVCRSRSWRSRRSLWGMSMVNGASTAFLLSEFGDRWCEAGTSAPCSGEQMLDPGELHAWAPRGASGGLLGGVDALPCSPVNDVRLPLADEGVEVPGGAGWLIQLLGIGEQRGDGLGRV